MSDSPCGVGVEEIEVAEAIEEMLEENALPEKVRKFLAAYKSLFSPDVEFDEDG